MSAIIGLVRSFDSTDLMPMLSDYDLTIRNADIGDRIIKIGSSVSVEQPPFIRQYKNFSYDRRSA